MKTKRQQKKVPKRHRKTRTYKGGDNDPWKRYTKNLNSLYDADTAKYHEQIKFALDALNNDETNALNNDNTIGLIYNHFKNKDLNKGLKLEKKLPIISDWKMNGLHHRLKRTKYRISNFVSSDTSNIFESLQKDLSSSMNRVKMLNVHNLERVMDYCMDKIETSLNAKFEKPDVKKSFIRWIKKSQINEYNIGTNNATNGVDDKNRLLQSLHASQVVKTLNKEKKLANDLLANAIPYMWGPAIAEVIRKMNKDKVNELFESFPENNEKKKDFQERILFAEVKKDGILYTDKSYITRLLKKVDLKNLIVTPDVVKLLSPEKIQKSENLPDLSEMKEKNIASYYKVLANLSPPLLNKLFEGDNGMTKFEFLLNKVTNPLLATPKPTPERFQNVLYEFNQNQSPGGLGEKTYTLQDVMENIFGSGSKEGVDDKTFIRMMVKMNQPTTKAITPMINYLENESRAIGRMRGVLQADEEDLKTIVGDSIEINIGDFDMDNLVLDETAVKQLNKTTSIIPNETSPSEKTSESKTSKDQKTSTQTVEDKNFEEMKAKIYEIINNTQNDVNTLETSIINFYNDNLHDKTELAAKLIEHLKSQDNNDTSTFAAEVLRKKNTTYYVDLDSFLRIFIPFWPTIETTTLTEENPSVLNRERSFYTEFFANPSYSTNTDQANQDPKTYGHSQTFLREDPGPSTIDFADIENNLRIIENEVTGEKEIKPEFVETYRVETHPNVAHMMPPNPNGSTIPTNNTANNTSPENKSPIPSTTRDDQDLIDSLLKHLQNLIKQHDD